MKNHLVVHAGTGTILHTDDCYVLDVTTLSRRQFDTISEGSDSEIAELLKLKATKFDQFVGDKG